MRIKSLVLALVLVAASVTTASAGPLLYEDVLYWMPDGSTQINPAVGPVTAIVKIQESVYSCDDGPVIVHDLDAHGLIVGPAPVNGGVSPAGPFELYVYAITNLNYGWGAGGAGNGVSGFNNTSPYALAGGAATVWAPVQGVTPWTPEPGFAGPIEWDNDKGLGIIRSQSRSEFLVAVPCGTAHGFYDGNWVHTWVGGVQNDLVYGVLSGPVGIPEPTTLVLLGAGLLVIARRRK